MLEFVKYLILFFINATLFVNVVIYVVSSDL